MQKDDLTIEFQKIDEEAGFLDRLIMIKTQRSLDAIELRAAAFLGFRHFIRHAYSFEIRNEPVESVLDTVKTVVEEFKREIAAAQ